MQTTHVSQTQRLATQLSCSMATKFDPFENRASHANDSHLIIEALQRKQLRIKEDVMQRFKVTIHGSSGIWTMGFIHHGKWLSQLCHHKSGKVIYDWWGVLVLSEHFGRCLCWCFGRCVGRCLQRCFVWSVSVGRLFMCLSHAEQASFILEGTHIMCV